jgi:thiosulfate dehydrogenase [quinone] large subunit
LNSEESERVADELATTYKLRVPRNVVASALANQPKLPVLLSRASFRPDADVRTEQRTRFQRDRRNALKAILGLAALSLSALTLAEIQSVLSQPPPTSQSASNSQPALNSATQPPAAVTHPQTQGSAILANASSILSDRSVTLNDPAHGPILLIHLDNGQFVAYSSICTHAGCEVQFDPSSKDIVCPCHGATYDPYNNARVLRGPAPYPLQKIAIRLDPSTGNIYSAG